MHYLSLQSTNNIKQYIFINPKIFPKGL
uniref:Uncharacterized protein n=1 Tax=Rhizophora mucronata TaxID=61149 RepID=A0A2P2NM19_RHIMU